MDSKYDNLKIRLQHFIERKNQHWKTAEVVSTMENITYVVSGVLRCVVDNEDLYAEKGDILYIPEHTAKRFNSSKSDMLHCCSLLFNCVLPGAEYERLDIASITHIGIDVELIGQMNKLNLIWSERQRGFVLRAEAILMVVISELLFHSGRDSVSDSDVRMRTVRNYIVSHYNESISVADLAELAGLNTVYFGTFFKRHTGYSVSAYINRIRVIKASDLLSTGLYRVSEVAYQCGFDDPLYFSRVFKEILGVTPSDVARSL